MNSGNQRILISIAILIFCSLHVKAQLNIVKKNDGIKEYTTENSLPYDSIMNLCTESFPSLPGQTLFMHGAKNDQHGYDDTFFTDNFLLDKRNIYKVDNVCFTPSKAVVGKYYDVLKVWTKRDYFSMGCCILLKEKESGDEIYYNGYKYPESMTCLGYYEKLKRYIGKSFKSLGIQVENTDGIVVNPIEGENYKCVDVALEMNSNGAFLVMEDEKKNRLKATPVGPEVYEFVSEDRINELTDKYGKKYGEQIAFRKVVIGMNEEMVRTAWGEPYRKSEITNNKSKIETWSYSNNRYVYITDGKVSDISIYK